jgi:glycosyltransferase involved in cell wall biosynthesis
LAGPAARLARIPVVWHVHAASPHPRLNRLAALLATRLVVSSAHLAVPGIPRRRIADAIPNSVAAPPALPARARHFPPRLLTLGRLDPVKNLDVLLSAVAMLRDRGVDVSLDVLGAEQPGYPEHAHALVVQRDELALADIVVLRGHIDDPTPFLRSATIYVHPSRHEMQPLAILEAMAAGLPVVASRAGGIPDLVRDGETGVLVPPGDAVALADALERLLGDDELTARLGVAGHERVRADFAPSTTIDRLEALYCGLLGVHR